MTREHRTELIVTGCASCPAREEISDSEAIYCAWEGLAYEVAKDFDAETQRPDGCPAMGTASGVVELHFVKADDAKTHPQPDVCPNKELNA